jgi:hypothetical protein
MDVAPGSDQAAVAFSLDHTLEVLRRTPSVLKALLEGLPDRWIRGVEGPGTWSPFDVVGHLIHADRTNWIPRARAILSQDQQAFAAFDRAAMLQADRGRSLADLLAEFSQVRASSLDVLADMRIGDVELSRTGVHPDLGQVTLRQLLATWTVHDLDHLQQIARVMARQYAEAVGPWKSYLRILKEGPQS